MAARARPLASAHSRERVSFAMGVVSDLLRIGRGENRRRRSRMAAVHGDGRVLPKWSVANVDRVVRPALPALVSCDDGIRHARTGTGPGVDAFSAETVANGLLFHRDAVADRNHPDGQLHISELSCSGARFSAFG